MKTNIIKMSVVAAMLLTSGAYAGKIVGLEAGTVWDHPSQQYSFGGWNLDNVNVKITDLDYVERVDKTFDPIDGTYTDMVVGDSFESEISTGGEIRALLHGKDWPVGEPAGIKAVHDDVGTEKSGKSPNCIMTTSYLDANATGQNEPRGYLDVYADGGTPVPTVCSSPFQTHKRFKINLQPTAVAEVTPGSYGKPIDLVFNLDTTDIDTTVRRYQVFQKINNYTSMRLDGYKIEVLDENGLVNDNLKFSLDISPTVTDESGYEATFAHGLWGPIEEKHFPENGFFDDVRAGFEQEGNNTAVLVGGPTQLPGNYADLFGTWLPSKWAPMGVFLDDDNDPLTDAELVAFWGTAPNAPEGTAPAWLKGQDYNLTDGDQSWAPLTGADLEGWNIGGEGSLYTFGVIEDTLNLGPNYVVEVGENAKIGKTFTIRITPHAAADQTPPSYIDENGTYIAPPLVPVEILPIDNTPEDGTTDDGTTDDGTPDDGTIDDGTTPPPVIGSGGGGCTYNPNSKNFDMTFLLMMALGLLYPFRKRFIK